MIDQMMYGGNWREVLRNSTLLNLPEWYTNCLLYTSDAADERSSVDLGGRRIIKKKKYHKISRGAEDNKKNDKAAE